MLEGPRDLFTKPLSISQFLNFCQQRRLIYFSAQQCFPHCAKHNQSHNKMPPKKRAAKAAEPVPVAASSSASAPPVAVVETAANTDKSEKQDGAVGGTSKEKSKRNLESAGEKMEEGKVPRRQDDV